MNSSKIASKIRYYRYERKLTQQQLADRVGVTWETISKYERDISKPFNRLDTIAKALNVTTSELLQENDKTNVSNQIPLFTKIPKDFKFESTNTSFFYNCPQWILQKDKNVFAIDMNLIKKEKDGIYYVSKNIKPKENNFVLHLEKGEVFVKKFQNQKNILGVVLAKEVRLF